LDGFPGFLHRLRHRCAPDLRLASSVLTKLSIACYGSEHVRRKRTSLHGCPERWWSLRGRRSSGAIASPPTATRVAHGVKFRHKLIRGTLFDMRDPPRLPGLYYTLRVLTLIQRGRVLRRLTPPIPDGVAFDRHGQ